MLVTNRFLFNIIRLIKIDSECLDYKFKQNIQVPTNQLISFMLYYAVGIGFNCMVYYIL